MSVNKAFHVKPESETLSECPVCKSFLSHSFSAEDYTVSHETFNIMKCLACSLLITNPRPTTAAIGQYYQSEEYISHSGTSKGLINKLYNRAKLFNIKSKYRLVETITGKSTGRILDYGCGRGDFLFTMKTTGWSIEGMEPDAKAAAVASQRCGIKIASPDDLFTLSDPNFDVITLWHVLEHVHKLNETIARLKSLLKPDGLLIIAVPNHESYDARFYKEYWAAYDVPRHLYHFNRKSMFKLLEKHLLACTTIKPLVLDSFYVSMLSEKYRKSFLGFLKGLFIGLLSDFKALSNNNWSSLIYVCRHSNNP
jgi:2-polyprenyl-3-methyl-5-hydroxy-6-metoxy-1,4-benzoquinol methylase